MPTGLLSKERELGMLREKWGPRSILPEWVTSSVQAGVRPPQGARLFPARNWRRGTGTDRQLGKVQGQRLRKFSADVCFLCHELSQVWEKKTEGRRVGMKSSSLTEYRD